jgi:kynurenine 3-monooxygenase
MRRADADAIAAMSLENYDEMRDTVLEPRFHQHKALSLELERRFPGRFVPRYSMVMFHAEIPYHEARARGARQQAILDELTRHLPPAAAFDDAAIDWPAARRLIEASLPPL